LREGVERLLEVDHIVINGEQSLLLPEGAVAPSRMQIRPGQLVNLATGESLACPEWLQRYGCSSTLVHAVAGIGNPGRFFATLRNEGFAIIAHPFPDHHRFTAADICFADALPVLMTEKDAVKCLSWADARHWCLKVDAVLPDAFLQALLAQVLTQCASQATQGLNP
jgi:tetraacyldisaccharide 4'-kinase